jgi:hypothetical protein
MTSTRPGADGTTPTATGTSTASPKGKTIPMTCADCGCLVDRGHVVARCGADACCCSHLPDADNDGSPPTVRAAMCRQRIGPKRRTAD